MNVEGRYLGSSPDQLQNVIGQSKSHGLIPKKHALEVTERLDRDGNVVVPLDEESARRAIRDLLADGVEAIAVSLLWSFRNPVHEQRIREIIHEIEPGRVRRSVERGQPPDPRVRPQRDHHHEHPGRTAAERTTSGHSRGNCGTADSPVRC